MPETGWTRDEMMTIETARRIRPGVRCFVGVGTPSLAACLARALHAPDAVLVYESGAIGAAPTVAPLSIADYELAETAACLVSVPELFSYWLQAGRIDLAVLGTAQIDRRGNLNTTVIGDYAHPKIRLPGAGGAPEIASGVREIVVATRHTAKAFVERVDFVTTPARPAALRAVITDLGVLQPDAATGELALVAVHSGVCIDEVRASTGWSLSIGTGCGETAPPTAAELAALRALELRTREAHSSTPLRRSA